MLRTVSCAVDRRTRDRGHGQDGARPSAGWKRAVPGGSHPREEVARRCRAFSGYPGALGRRSAAPADCLPHRNFLGERRVLSYSKVSPDYQEDNDVGLDSLALSGFVSIIVSSRDTTRHDQTRSDTTRHDNPAEERGDRTRARDPASHLDRA